MNSIIKLLVNFLFIVEELLEQIWMNHIKIHSAVSFVWLTLHGIGFNYRFLLIFRCQIKMQMTKGDPCYRGCTVTRSFVLISGTKKRIEEVASPRTIHDLPEHVLTCGLSLPGKQKKNKFPLEKSYTTKRILILTI